MTGVDPFWIYENLIPGSLSPQHPGMCLSGKV
jgi:hypothetical protein